MEKKKERRYDERYKRIREQTQAGAWGITMFAIVIAFIFEGSGFALYLFSAVYVITIVSYLITFIIADKKN